MTAQLTVECPGMQLTGTSQGPVTDSTDLPCVVFLEACNLLDEAIRCEDCMECFHIHRVGLVLYLQGQSHCLYAILCVSEAGSGRDVKTQQLSIQVGLHIHHTMCIEAHESPVRGSVTCNRKVAGFEWRAEQMLV